MIDMMAKAFWQVIMEYVVKFCMVLALGVWACALSLTFCFTSNYFITNFEQSNVVTKTGINFIRSFRHNCRIIWGTVLALDPKMYPGVTAKEISMLPKPQNALYQFNTFWGPTQKQGIHLLSIHALELERASLAIFLSSKDIYVNSHLSKMQWNYDLNRDPASNEDTKENSLK